MSNKTANYNLVKPLGNENYDINVQNGNMDIIDTEIKKVNSSVDSLGQSVATSLADMTTYSTYKSNKDSNDIYTTIDFKRGNGTLYKKSILSGGTSPQYTTQTITYYKADGITVDRTEVYTLSYDANGNILSEVKQ